MGASVSRQELETIVTITRSSGTGTVVTLVLNRPHRGNSLDATMRAELTSTYSSLAADRDLRALIVTGTGDRHFCTGMDLAPADRPLTIEQRVARIRANPHMAALASLPVPTIAAVNGVAAGGGCEMALACDFRVLALNARLWFPEVGLGLVPGAGGSQRLPRLMGSSRAAGPLFLGEQIDADTALTSGLAYKCVPPGDLLTAADQLADQLAAQDPTAMRVMTALFRASQALPLAEGLTLEQDAVAELLVRRDAARGGTTDAR
jgi:enoyl-CoA hydratase/carnithine racemase